VIQCYQNNQDKKPHLYLILSLMTTLAVPPRALLAHEIHLYIHGVDILVLSKSHLAVVRVVCDVPAGIRHLDLVENRRRDRLCSRSPRAAASYR